MQMEWMARRDESSSSHLGNFLNATILAVPDENVEMREHEFLFPPLRENRGKRFPPRPDFSNTAPLFSIGDAS